LRSKPHRKQEGGGTAVPKSEGSEHPEILRHLCLTSQGPEPEPAEEADKLDILSLIIHRITQSKQGSVVPFALTEYIKSGSQAGYANKWKMETAVTSLAESQYIFIFLFPLCSAHSWFPLYVSKKGWVVVPFLPLTFDDFNVCSFC
jgi:hypothetical protein